ncbi:MAG TPA: 2-hydroxychromene-2-carboxylate isomerase [Dongiaceae bacterium]
MTNVIEFWFDFSSPYAYFGALEIENLATKHKRRVQWRPFLLGPAFKATGGQPIVSIPLRGDYARRDWARAARRADIPFALPTSFPTGSVAAARAFYWLERERPDLLGRYVLAIFRAYFSDGQEIHNTESVIDIAATLGADRPQLAAAMASPAIKDRLRAITDEAQARGIFGAPFVIVDDEPFWGADRLSMVDEWLRHGGW